jgi:glycerate kinase
VKIVIAPDSFKGTLSATEVARAIAEGIRALRPDWQLVEVPVADGGEGTVEAVLGAVPGRRISAMVKSPLLTEVKADFAVIHNPAVGGAIIEMAQASGLALVPEEKRNPLLTTTFGTGQLVLRAIEEGCPEIMIGLGGSATVDGGAGMGAALGVRFADEKGEQIPLGGGGLSQLHRIDLSGRVDVSRVRITSLSDVTNPLLGENGAARVFAPQKGATPEMVRILERNLARLASIIKRDVGVDVADVPGAGAAGGLGAGIVAFLDGKIESGIAVIMELVGLRKKIRGADLVITGEGRFDFQTARGKAPMGVAKVAGELGVPTVAICGSFGEGYAEAAKVHFLAVLSLEEIAGSKEEAMRRPKELLREALRRLLASCPLPVVARPRVLRKEDFDGMTGLTR